MSGPQRTVSAAARPAPPAPAKPTRARRRPALVALGLALVAVSVLASVFLTESLGQTRKVLAVNAPVARGEVITEGDLVIVDLPLGPTTLLPISEGQEPDVVGQVATTDLLKGQLLTEGAFDTKVGASSGMSVVGVALAPHQMPTTELRPGDLVRIVETPVTGGEPPIETPLAICATVVGTKPVGLVEQTVVDVEVAEADAPPLAARAATGRVALLLDAAGSDACTTVGTR
ncbi:SAF domain-containing protein [Antribacter gilvus]|uniref:SAF domain-containing protein n=1 Tax=Antribacter gilvus TaxID=2304675 RepID=UPI0013DFE341|nr:SAF domain-containing protein [Antribacter gilvus]